ncbi:MAG TPA: WecB/TagA/CpsF family glycosyltransferase [Candidatus Binatia bacterium]|nr:WecB/TagA/CpsF family glycosyltransferase [Candidatus Binatia bacterium]
MLPTETQAPRRANVLGVGVSAIDMEDALRRSEALLAEGRKGYICVTGVHGIMEAGRDHALRGILNRSFLCTPDGMPTVWVGRLQGHRGMRRVYGPDLMLELCRRSAKRGYRHFLYGGKPGVADRLKQRLESLAPGIRIVGTYTPPFRPLTAAEEEEVIALVALANVDIVWVGLSTPAQERFMAHMIDRLDTCLMVGVGAAFDIHAGLLRDAPAWMKSCGLQWLHRLAQEPQRLCKRYLANNPRFMWEIGLQFAGIRRSGL